ncbi:MAG: hypothetical protein WBA57_03385 [Elainellaceae cyanobacterium]
MNGLALPSAEARLSFSNGFEDDEEIPEPNSLDDLGDVFKLGGFSDFTSPIMAENDVPQWALCSINPGDVLLKLPGLSVKPYMRLVSFFYPMAEQTAGIIWAVPESYSTTAHLEDTLLLGGDIHHPPQPPEALSDFMNAIEGDRSPASFLIASILRREFLDFGSHSDSHSWRHHRLIDSVPQALKPYWNDAQPKDLVPKVNVLEDGRVAVEFFTCRVKPPISICRHIDQYLRDRYAAKSIQRTLLKLESHF